MLYFAYAAVNSQRMGVWGVGGKAHIALVEYFVDVGVILLQHGLNGIQLVLFSGVLLDAEYRVCDVAQNGEDAEEGARIVMDSHQAVFYTEIVRAVDALYAGMR